MNRHAIKKQTGIFGLLFVLIAVVFGVVINISGAKAISQTSTTDVKFTFNSTLNLTIDKQNLTISNLLPGNTGESDVAKLTIDTNADGGYYLSATAGKSGGDANLNKEGGSAKFTNMSTDASFSSIGEASNDTWGFNYALGNSDSPAWQKYTGLPLDDTTGSSGKKLIDANDNKGEKIVKCKVGAKAGPTMPAGTYKGEIHFYVVTKN